MVQRVVTREGVWYPVDVVAGGFARCHPWPWCRGKFALGASELSTKMSKCEKGGNGKRGGGEEVCEGQEWYLSCASRRDGVLFKLSITTPLLASIRLQLKSGLDWPWVFFIPGGFAALVMGVNLVFLKTSPAAVGFPPISAVSSQPGSGARVYRCGRRGK